MGRRAQLQSDRGNPRLKFLDRYVGIPLLAVLTVPRRLRAARPVPEEPRVVGVMVTAGIGDLVLASGSLADLRAAYPQARLVLFVTANNVAFAPLLAGPDEVVELPVRRLDRAVRMLRGHRCDLLIDLSAWRRFDALLAWSAGAGCTVGLRTPGQHRHGGYDIVVDHETGHEIDNDRHVLAAVGVRAGSAPRILRPDDRPAPVATPYAVLHLWPGGANFEERSWPVESWRRLADELAARGLAVALTGGPEDVAATDALVTQWRAAGIDAHRAVGGSWSESLAWLDHAVGVVSVNTGVMHVAAALGTPTIALNGPTSGRRWGPIGPFTRCVASPMVPDGYLNLGFERDDRFRDCMRAIEPSMVVAAWDELMAERAASESA